MLEFKSQDQLDSGKDFPKCYHKFTCRNRPCSCLHTIETHFVLVLIPRELSRCVETCRYFYRWELILQLQDFLLKRLLTDVCAALKRFNHLCTSFLQRGFTSASTLCENSRHMCLWICRHVLVLYFTITVH